jgi:hypothetical protein
MDRRLLAAAAGVAVSLLVSVLVWVVFDVPFLLFFVPFVPFLFRRESDRTVRRCPVCEFQTTDGEYDYCPRDGHRLE